MIEQEAYFFDLEMIMDLSEIIVAYIIKKVVDLKKEFDVLEIDISKLEKVSSP